jgi:hypothetical protein
MLNHRQYSHALRSNRRSGPREEQSRERVDFIKNTMYKAVNKTQLFIDYKLLINMDL